MDVSQTVIPIVGISAAYMSMVSQNPKVRAWAPVVGLTGQPFWLYSTCAQGNWGMFITSVLYTLVFLAGTINFVRRRNHA